MKKFYFLVTIIIFTIFLSACWDYREVEDIYMVSTIALDKDKRTEEYILNIEVIDVTEAGTSVQFNPIILESRGTSIVEAVRNLISITTRTPYWSNVSLIIVGQDLAKEDISPVLDWIARSPELPLKLQIFISKEKTAVELLHHDLEITKLRLFKYDNIREAFEHLNKSPVINAAKVINQVQRSDMDPVLPTLGLVEHHGETSMEFIGAAYFHNGKLVGFLNPMDTMKYLFVTDEINGGVLTIPTNDDKGIVSLHINRSNTKTDIDFMDGKIHITIKINSAVNISEINDKVDYTTPKGRKMLKEKSDEYVENEIKNFIEEMQKGDGIDIFHFGNKIMRKHPSVWKEIEDNWSEKFRQLEIEVISDIRIKSSQHTTTPIGVEKDD